MKKYYQFQLLSVCRSSKASLQTLAKWMVSAAIMGIAAGFIGFAFGWLLGQVTDFRLLHPYMLYLLPCIGLVITGLYDFAGEGHNSGTNVVISAIQSDRHVPFRILPLIFSGTLLTHLCGGSVGREGAALQMGGSVGNYLAQLLKMDARDSKVLIMCGMSAFFAALFGTPVTAAIFSIEVVSVGIMHYAALVPCILSSLIASGISGALGLHAESFPVAAITQTAEFSVYLRILILAMLCSAVSILFILLLHNTERLLHKRLKNPYIRTVTAGAVIICLTLILQNDAFLGAGNAVIGDSFAAPAPWFYFLLKMIFTSVTIAGGYKGGEIIPSLFIGATLGSFCSVFLGLPQDLCAACAMAGIFCGVTNCPITTIFLSVELFGMDNLNYYVIAIAVSYLLSGYYSLYNSQKIMYSKTRTEFVNHQANKRH